MTQTLEGGTLFVVGTPIGNLTDLSHRAGEILKGVTLVAAEDTRQTRKLMNHLGANAQLIRADEEKEAQATETVLRYLAEGKSAALVSDAGSPAVSDPGARLVDSVYHAGFKVIPIPGPCAVTTALSVAGFHAVPFTFEGFLPRKSGARTKTLARILESACTTVFFESPHRIRRTLQELSDIEPNRRIALCREMTKVHEESIRGTVQEVIEALSSSKERGEFTIVVSGLTKKDIRNAKKKSKMKQDR